MSQKSTETKCYEREAEGRIILTGLGGGCGGGGGTRMGTGNYPAVFSLGFAHRERWSNYSRLCANQNRRAEENQAKPGLKDIIVPEML